jgi:hypothetical protein
VVAAATLSGIAEAGPNLVQNGDFALLTNGPNNFIGYGVSELLDWTYGAAPHPNAAVYTFAGANGAGAEQDHLGVFYPLYGPGHGYNNGFVPSPVGGNFLASDGEASFQGAISQTITGLTPGHEYQLSFDWAGNEFLDSTTLPVSGPLTIAWQTSLGAQTFTTPVATYDAHDFTGWMTQTFTFTATSTSEVLSFLAEGAPNGVPPVALLDAVSLTAVPEPASLGLVAVGIAGLGLRWCRKSRTQRRVAPAA